MRFVQRMSLALLALAGAAVPSFAMSPLVLFQAEGMREAVRVPVGMDRQGSYRMQEWEYDFDGSSMRIEELNMAPDASLDFSLTVHNFTHDPIQYTFVFWSPIVALPNPAEVHSTLAGALVDGNENGVSLQPFDEPNVMTSYVANDIPSPIDLGIGLGGSFVEPWNGGTPHFYGPFESADTPVPDPGSWAYLGTRVGFELSGHDSAVLVGGTTYEGAANPVPEPATVGLFGLGLLGLGLVKRRRK